MENRFEKFTYYINEISKYWQKIAQEELSQYGLKSSHALYLTTIYKHENGISGTELSEYLGRDKADVSRMTNILIKKDYLKKESNNKNQYGGLFKLTKIGIEVAKEINIKAEKIVNLAGGNLSDKSRADFYSTLEMITNNLKDIHDK